MCDRNELDAERADIDAPAGRDHRNRDVRRLALGFAFCLEQRGAELRRIDRASQLRPEIDDGAEMILMGVRQHQAHQILALLHQERNVGHDQVDARQMLLVAEGDAEIDREPGALGALAEAVDRQVHADLADAAERRKGQFIGTRHHADLAEAAVPKKTSPAVTGSNWPEAVRTIRQPCASIVSKMPSIVEPDEVIATGCPRLAARSSHSLRISPKPRPLSQMPRNSTQLSDSAENSSSAPICTPRSASETAGVGVPCGAPTMLVPMPTTIASRSSTISASSEIPTSFLPPTSTSFG